MSGIESQQHSRKWLVVHGHFYQPPRENPWLDTIETQTSAAPFHDWNERIYSQCYRPNAYSRLLDSQGMITGINNNYDYLSFNFGPTLLSWLEEEHPVTLGRVVAGDAGGARRCGGHGNALAQVYNHIIMPLASRRDKLTQIRWAKASFKRLFKREARGMWLAETAINMETVECLIEEKIAFVVLSPNQAEALRPLKGRAAWIENAQGALDTRRPYRLFATDASGKKTNGHIDVFFFDEGLSKEVSFNGLLQDAHILGNRINSCYSASPQQDEIVVIATDGETFGHHKPFGDMCLAYFFTQVAPSLGIQVVNFDYFRSVHPPQNEVRLKNAFGEGTAWSCAHGVGRWIRDCGCNTGGEAGWNQQWRTPLRQALVGLQAEVDKQYVDSCSRASVDPWELRDWYTDRFHSEPFVAWKKALKKHAPMVTGSDAELSLLRQLLEAQKYMLFSFTSCGWFFSELSGIEPMQNLAFACRALQLGVDKEEYGQVLDSLFAVLARAKSNIGNDTGETLFKKQILPFIHHNHMMAFVAVVEKMLNMAPGAVIRRYGYDCLVEETLGSHKKRAAASPKGGLYQVTIFHERYNVNETFAVVIDVAPGNKPQAWVLLHGAAAKKTTLNPEIVVGNPSSLRFTLSDVFPSLREEVASQYLQRITSTSYEHFYPWFKEHEADLSALSILFPSLPGFFGNPVGFVLQEQWDASFRGLDLSVASACAAEVATIHQNVVRFGASIDYAYSASQCEKLLVATLGSLQQELDYDSLDSLCTILDIVDTYGLPVSKHRLEDIMYPLLTGKVRDLILEQKSRGKSGKKKKDDEIMIYINTMLKFARRMNFNANEILHL